jgi:hypothetical protein
MFDSRVEDARFSALSSPHVTNVFVSKYIKTDLKKLISLSTKFGLKTFSLLSGWETVDSIST